MPSLTSSFPPPPLPPGLLDDDDENDDKSISTTSTTSSSGERNQFLPKLFQPKFETRSRGRSPPPLLNNHGLLGGGDIRGGLEPPPPPPPIWGETRPIGDGSTSGGGGGTTVSTLGPLSPAGEMAPAVPTYPSSKRMLMRSPLPSPKPLKKILRPQAAIRQGSASTEDSDSESDRKKREETAMKRLVQMAKQQQNFAVAWFAASSGEEPMLPAMVPKPKSSKQRPRSRSNSSSNRKVPGAGGPGPVDLDLEGDGQDDDQSTASSRSSASSKMRSFLKHILPNPNNNNNNDRASDESSGVVRNSSSDQSRNGSLAVCNENDESTAQSSTGSDTCGSGRNKLIQRLFHRPAILILLLLSIVAVIGAAILFAQAGAEGNDDKNANSVVRDDTTDTPTPSPTMKYSTSPSLMPSFNIVEGDSDSDAQYEEEYMNSLAPSRSFQPTGSPSVTPTLAPTVTASMSPSSYPTASPSERPSASPSVSPTSMPSASPSASPTAVPSVSPTISISPSSAPSQSPTTEFFTTVFEQLGYTHEGQQDNEQFGYSISLSSDGKVMAVGSRNFALEGKRSSGKVQIYDMDEFNDWIPRGDPLVGENSMDQFGFDIALSSDGSRIAISEPGLNGPDGARSGSVRVFDWTGVEWTKVGDNIYGEAQSDYFGISIALSGDGQRLAAAAPYHEASSGPSKAGRVRILEYTTETDTWTRIGDALDGTGQLEWFGWDVDLSKDGNTVAIGAPRNNENGGYVRCFKWNSNSQNWLQLGEDIVNNLGKVQLDDRFGMAISLSSKGDRVAVGSPWKDDTSQNSGLVAVYQLEDNGSRNSWSIMGEPFTGSSINHQLGWSLDLSGTNGDFLAIGIPGHGSCGTNCGRVTFHSWDGQLWDSTSTPLNGDKERDDFGWAIASSEESSIVAIGAVQAAGGKGYARLYGSSI